MTKSRNTGQLIDPLLEESVGVKWQLRIKKSIRTNHNKVHPLAKYHAFRTDGAERHRSLCGKVWQDVNQFEKDLPAEVAEKNMCKACWEKWEWTIHKYGEREFGKIPWVEYSRLYLPEPGRKYLVTDGRNAAVQFMDPGSGWRSGKFESAYFVASSQGGIPDMDVTHYAEIDIPER
ncbi:hypothetical protein ACTHPH_21925 [Paenibacillus pasadenensis]|uniref:hypothetical protein n=1 Tax=Paenibacillus pasadenensis TaxID=217090 RepID=UPI00048B3C51|nr:hypothetical protein [Paenibacillus pasadenensis]